MQGNRAFAEMTDAYPAGKKTRVIPFDPRDLAEALVTGARMRRFLPLPS